MRLFVAAELDADVRRRLEDIQRSLRAVPLQVRWVKPEGIHLTLKFLGEVGSGRLDPIRDALAGALARVGAFTLSAEGVGTFPPRGLPRVIWVGLQGDLPAAERLQAAIDAALATCGFPPESRPFRPHLTLGRVTGGGHGNWAEFLAREGVAQAGRFAVGECVLFRSHLDPGGARYEPLARFALQPAVAP